MNVEVLIVGAGPTGLALACDLARRGVQFRIVDKADVYFIGSKGKGLQPRSLEVMDDFGIVDQVLRNGKFHVPFRGYEGAKVLGERDPHEGRYPTPSTPYASPLLTPQWRVEEALRGLLERSGGRVELATEVIALDQDVDGVTATLACGDRQELVRCRYLVAADGGKSFVRKQLEVPFEGETWKDERMYVGDVRLRGLDREAWHSWPHADGWLALCPLPSTDEFQLQAQTPPGEEREPSLELFRQMVKERTGGMDIELTEAPWLSLYRANVRMVSRYRSGRVFLAGDAAHVHSPAGGQGMNTGIQDAYNLGWKLGRVLEGAPDALLDTYEEERLPVAAHVLGLSTKLHRQITSAADEDKVRRDAVTLQLGISYKEMSLSKDAGGTNWKIAAGDRAPDAPGLNAAGEPVRLFDLFRGPQFTLLRLSGSDREIDAKERRGVKRVEVTALQDKKSNAEGYVDAFGHFAAAYGGGEGDYMLIRPDGYVGWVGPEENLSDLDRYPALGQ